MAPIKFLTILSLIVFCTIGVLYYKTTLGLNANRQHRTTIEAVKLRLLKDEMFLRRRRHMMDACAVPSQEGAAKAREGFETLSLNPQTLKNVIVNDKHKVLYCYVPKVACTNWKKMMVMLMTGNLTDPKLIPADSVHRDIFPKLSDFQNEDIIHRLSTYNKFLFVRRPMERLVSAFRNKFVMNYTSSAYFKKRYGVLILKRFRKGQTFPSTGDGVKFSEFVQYIIETFDKDPKLLNEHWKPSSLLCHPCQVRYNLIGKYDTLERDAKYILEEIEAPYNIKFPPVSASRTTALVNSYISSLTKKQIEGLRRVYDDDFKLFEYDWIKEYS